MVVNDILSVSIALDVQIHFNSIHPWALLTKKFNFSHPVFRYISLTIKRTGGQRQIHLCKNDLVSRSSLLRWPHFQTPSPWLPLLTFSNWSKIFRENDISRSGATFPVNNNLQTPKAHQARQERLGQRWWCFGMWFPPDLLKWENHLATIQYLSDLVFSYAPPVLTTARRLRSAKWKNNDNNNHFSTFHQ